MTMHMTFASDAAIFSLSASFKAALAVANSAMDALPIDLPLADEDAAITAAFAPAVVLAKAIVGTDAMTPAGSEIWLHAANWLGSPS